MKVSDAIAEILRREGVETIIGYPVNHILERGAAAGIRPIIVRQERIGLHMAEAMSRVTSGRQLGVFVMQHGPGTENAFGGVAQSYGDSCPVVVLPAGYARNINQVPLLGNIPFLGNLFKHTQVNTSNQELIFFITPRIIQT